MKNILMINGLTCVDCNLSRNNQQTYPAFGEYTPQDIEFEDGFEDQWRSEVWGIQIQLTKKEILELREERKALSIAWAKEKNKEKEEALKGAIGKLDEEIQAEKAKLEEITKKYEKATQGEKRKSISDYERGSKTKGKRFKIDTDVEEFFQALRDTPFTEGTAMQLVRITKNILVPGHRASWIRGSKHPSFLPQGIFRSSTQISRTLSTLPGIAKSVAFLLMYIKVALENDEKVAFYSVPEKCLYLLEVQSGRVYCKKLKVLDEGWTEHPDWEAFDSKSTHLVVDPENGFGHLNVNVTKAFVVVASSPNKEWKQFEKLLKAGTKKRDLTLYADVIQEDEFNDISAGNNESGGADGNCTVEDLKSRSEIAGGILRHIVDEQKFKKFQDSQDHMLRKDVALPSSVFCIRPILEDGSHTSSDFVLDFLSPYVESRVVGALAGEQSKQSESMSGLEAERRWFHLIKNGGNFEGRHVGSHLPEELKGKTTTVSFSRHKRVIHHRENSKEEKNKCLEEIRELKDSSTLVICPPNYTNIDGASSAEVLHQMAKGNVHDFKVKHKDEVLVYTKVVTIYYYTLEKHHHTFRVNFVYKDVSKSDQEAWKKTWHKHLRFVVVKLDPVRFWGKLQEVLRK
eukprot:jgi/Bigna1/88681/estExt_fgenesh1_pg.C_360072